MEPANSSKQQEETIQEENICDDIVAESYSIATQGVYDDPLNIIHNQEISIEDSNSDNESENSNVDNAEKNVVWKEKDNNSKEYVQLQNCNVENNDRQEQYKQNTNLNAYGGMFSGQQIVQQPGMNTNIAFKNPSWTHELPVNQRHPQNIQLQYTMNSTPNIIRDHYSMNQPNTGYISTHDIAASNEYNFANQYSTFLPAMPIVCHQQRGNQPMFNPLHTSGLVGNSSHMQNYHAMPTMPNLQALPINHMISEPLQTITLHQEESRNENTNPESEGSDVEPIDDLDDSDEDEVKLAAKTKRKKRGRKPKKAKIKRPMNAFMVWAKKHRTLLAKQFSGLTNADISVMLGEKWSKMTLEEKQPYFDEADLIKEQHRRDHPDWTYQPKPKRRRFGGNGKSYLFEVTKNMRGSYTTRHINDVVVQQIPAQAMTMNPVVAKQPRGMERYVQGPVVANGKYFANSVPLPSHLVSGEGIILAQPGQFHQMSQIPSLEQMRNTRQNPQIIQSNDSFLLSHQQKQNFGFENQNSVITSAKGLINQQSVPQPRPYYTLGEPVNVIRPVSQAMQTTSYCDPSGYSASISASNLVKDSQQCRLVPGSSAQAVSNQDYTSTRGSKPIVTHDLGNVRRVHVVQAPTANQAEANVSK